MSLIFHFYKEKVVFSFVSENVPAIKWMKAYKLPQSINRKNNSFASQQSRCWNHRQIH